MIRRRGFSLLELVVVICIVALLAALANERLRGLQAEAERASMQHVLGAVRSALALEVAARLARGEADTLVQLASTNPMDHLSEQPGNYLGALQGADPVRIPPGHWYFDRDRALLIYRVRHVRFVETAVSGPAQIRFKLVAIPADSTKDGNFETHGTIRGLAVRAVEPYRWVDPRGAKKDWRS